MIYSIGYEAENCKLEMLKLENRYVLNLEKQTRLHKKFPNNLVVCQKI